MRRPLLTLVAIATAGAVLGGCSSLENALDEVIPLPAAGQAAAIGLGLEVVKTKIERRMEMTCNPLNMISDGTYCVSNYKPTDRQEVWCFKTLGGVDCYGEPDPYSLAGRALPESPRPLADPRMPMTPPGRRPPPQVAVAPVGMEQPAQVVPAEPAAAMPVEPMVEPAAAPAAVRQQ